MQAAVSIGLTVLVALASTSAAQAEMRQCSAHRVDYLVGGVGKAGTGGRTCGAVTALTPTSSTSRSAAVASSSVGLGVSRVTVPDDEGRRSILQQELDKTRASLSELDKSPVLFPSAGTLAEQRARKVADISSLEAELGRIKR